MRFRTVILLSGCCQLLAAQAPPRLYQAQLQTPLASYLRSGTPLTALLTGPLDAADGPQLPRGTVVSGIIKRARPVGLGLARERASIEVEFTSCTLPGATDLPCTAVLTAIDNARERVIRPNHIQGILAASHPHSWLSGVWYRPAPMLFGKAPAGLTGAAGMVHARMTGDPVSALAIVGSRLALFGMPEPEIEIPPGATVFLSIEAQPGLSHQPLDGDEPGMPLEPFLDDLRAQPETVTKAGGNPAGDIINFAFLGSRADLENAFAVAGWHTADPLTPGSFTRTYRAATSMSGYPTAPVSALFYQGRLPDLVFQKSLNSIAQRHHIRLWLASVQGVEVWLGAATHDVAIAFEFNRMSFTHRIDADIDRERSIVLNDLISAGCTVWHRLLQRPDSGIPPPAAVVVTDGALALIRLQPCDAGDDYSRLHRGPRRPFPARLARRVILESRHYFTRSNVYYWAYRSVRWSFGLGRPARGTDDATVLGALTLHRRAAAAGGGSASAAEAVD
ncbi:MAG: hypothetical protein C0504_16455 [Candidatus Solibacter sp.]|nr:hypothetical protein [Candidatus Solibacter sp.]